jgi:hypothetical protein
MYIAPNQDKPRSGKDLGRAGCREAVANGVSLTPSNAGRMDYCTFPTNCSVTVTVALASEQFSRDVTVNLRGWGPSELRTVTHGFCNEI